MRLVIIFVLLSLTSVCHSAIFKKGWGYRPFDKYFGGTFSLNPDKSYISLYFDMKTRKPVDLTHSKELDLYKNLLYKSLIPSFVLFELTYYPLTDLGGYIYKEYRRTYDSLGFDTPELGSRGRVHVNIISAMASRYEPPYSFSIFIGDLIPFLVKKEVKKKTEETNKESLIKGKQQVGSALMGFALSFGQRRMKQMEILQNDWYYLAWKVRGSRKTETKKMAWRFEVGYLHHSNDEFIKALSFTFMRDKAIVGEKKFSLLDNSKIEYSFQIPVERISSGKKSNDDNNSAEEVQDEGFELTRYTTFQKLVIGANFPLKKSLILTTEIGFKWEAIKDLERERPQSEVSLIFVPGLLW